MAWKKSKSDREPLTRRQFSTALVGAAAAALGGTEADANAQEKPAENKNAATPDPRTAQLERERALPFTPEQSKALPEQLKGQDTAIADMRKFALSEGGSEPYTVFTPGRPDRKAGRKKGAAHG